MKKCKSVVVVLMVCAFCFLICACGSASTRLKVPDIENTDVETAKTYLINKNLIPKIEYEYNNDYEYDAVIRTYPEIGTLVAEDTPVTIYACKGPSYYELPQSLSTIYDIEGIDPFVSWLEAEDGVGTKSHESVRVEEGYLYITMRLACKSPYTLKFYGDFGDASINDTFEKTVPIDVIYEDEKINNKGENTYFDFKIPLSDLGVQKPTNLNIRYYITINGKRETCRADFDLTW